MKFIAIWLENQNIIKQQVSELQDKSPRERSKLV